MKQRLILPALTLSLAAGYGVQQDAEQDNLKDQITVLEERMVAVEGYLQAQAAAEAALVPAIDKAVDQGYTSGINFEARQSLVNAWKLRAKAAEQKVPGAKKKGPAERVDPRLARRRGK